MSKTKRDPETEMKIRQQAMRIGEVGLGFVLVVMLGILGVQMIMMIIAAIELFNKYIAPHINKPMILFVVGGAAIIMLMAVLEHNYRRTEELKKIVESEDSKGE